MVPRTSWRYSNETYRSEFETFFRTTNNGIYIGVINAGWSGCVVGYKSDDYGAFAMLGYGSTAQTFQPFVTINNGVFIWNN